MVPEYPPRYLDGSAERNRPLSQPQTVNLPFGLAGPAGRLAKLAELAVPEYPPLVILAKRNRPATDTKIPFGLGQAARPAGQPGEAGGAGIPPWFFLDGRLGWKLGLTGWQGRNGGGYS